MKKRSGGGARIIVRAMSSQLKIPIGEAAAVLLYDMADRGILEKLPTEWEQAKR